MKPMTPNTVRITLGTTMPGEAPRKKSRNKKKSQAYFFFFFSGNSKRDGCKPITSRS